MKTFATSFPRPLVACVVLTASLLLGCNGKPSITPEEACLQSDALTFKDPTSLKVVANLGDRKYAAPNQPKDSFWIRYVAKNSYGAYISKNMACSKSEQGWKRDRSIEQAAIHTVRIRRLDIVIEDLKVREEKLRACKQRPECLREVAAQYPPDPGGDRAMAAAERLAEVDVLESPTDVGTP